MQTSYLCLHFLLKENNKRGRNSSALKRTFCGIHFQSWPLILYSFSYFSLFFARFSQVKKLNYIYFTQKIWKKFSNSPCIYFHNLLSGSGDGSHSISSPRHTAITWLPVKLPIKNERKLNIYIHTHEVSFFTIHTQKHTKDVLQH